MRLHQSILGAIPAFGLAAVILPSTLVAADDDLCIGQQHVACDEEWHSIGNSPPDLFGDPAISGRWAILGKRGDDEALGGPPHGVDAGAVYFYRLIDGRWEFHSKVPNPDPQPEGHEWLGQSVAIDGNRAVASAAGWENNRGRLLVFEYDSVSQAWLWADELTAPGAFAQPGDQLGASEAHTICRKGVAISGEIVAGGAPLASLPDPSDPQQDLSEAGYAAIFQEGQQLVIGSSDFGLPPEAGARIGSAVVLDDDRIAIGEPHRDVLDQPNGRVYVARYEVGQWISEGVLASPDLGGEGDTIGGDFGFSLALDGDLLVVGAPAEDRVYFFDYEHATGTWEFSGISIANPLESSGHFGVGLSLDGSQLLIGDPGNHRAHLYQRTATGEWQLRRTFAPHSPLNSVSFGFSVALFASGAIVADFDESHIENDETVVPKGGIAYFFRHLPTCGAYVPPCGN